MMATMEQTTEMPTTLEETIFIVLKRQWHVGPPQAKDNGR